MALQHSDRRSHEQLLRLVDNYADEASLRERTIEELKKRKLDLTAEVETALADLGLLKESRTAAGDEARELRVELQAVEAAVNFKQAKLSNIQQEISKTNTSLEKLEDDEKCIRDHFIKTMMEINSRVRTMQSAHSGPPLKSDHHYKPREPSNVENDHLLCKPSAKKSRAVDKAKEREEEEEKLSEYLRDIRSEQAHLLALKENLDGLKESLQDRKSKHTEYIASVRHATQDLTYTRNKSAELEDQVTALTTELQGLYTCSKCGTDNIGQ